MFGWQTFYVFSHAFHEVTPNHKCNSPHKENINVNIKDWCKAENCFLFFLAACFKAFERHLLDSEFRFIENRISDRYLNNQSSYLRSITTWYSISTSFHNFTYVTDHHQGQDEEKRNNYNIYKIHFGILEMRNICCCRLWFSHNMLWNCCNNSGVLWRTNRWAPYNVTD